jgi:putative hemolysin
VDFYEKNDGSGRQLWAFKQVGKNWEISIVNGKGLQSPKDNVLTLVGNGSDDVVLRAAEPENSNLRRFQLWTLENPGSQTQSPSTAKATSPPSTKKPSPASTTSPTTLPTAPVAGAGSGTLPPYQTAAPGDPTLPPNASCFLSPEQIASGSSLSPPNLPYCTRAPTAFETETCKNSGGNLVYRDMYGQSFAYCVYPGGRSCMVEDVANGWCSAPPTPAPSKCPTADPFPFYTSFPQSNGGAHTNALSPLVPALLGTAGSELEGSSASGGDGLAYSTYGADPSVQNPVSDPTQFFSDQTGLANTGVTSETVSQLANAQAIAYNNPASSGSSDFAPQVPQPFPVVTPTEAPSTEPPAATLSPMATTLATMLAQSSTPAPSSPSGFFRLGNALFWLALGILLLIAFLTWRKFRKSASQTQNFA